MTPTPETKEALLWSEEANAWTKHTFVETKEVAEAYEFIYECSVTGARRRWGLVREEVN